MSDLLIDIRGIGDTAYLRIEALDSHKVFLISLQSVWPQDKEPKFHFQSKIDEATLLHFLREK